MTSLRFRVFSVAALGFALIGTQAIPAFAAGPSVTIPLDARNGSGESGVAILTADGAKISKSAGNAADPGDLAARYGTDTLRWWFLSEVAQAGDTDFTIARMVARANDDLANNLGNFMGTLAIPKAVVP